MATVIGLVETAKAYLPSFGSRRRRAVAATDGDGKIVPPAALVTSVIAEEVIPRMLLAHRRIGEGSAAPASADAHISVDEARAFAPYAIELEADALLDRVEAFLRRGVSIDTIFVELLAPAARRLGELWEDDLCDFVDVTMGLWRLQEIVRELSGRIPEVFDHDRMARHALFSVVPDDQHSFGTVVIEDVFRRAGWQTNLMTSCTRPDLLDRVARTHFDLVGLTVSRVDHIGQLPSLILALRSVSRNPRLCVMIGGPVLVADPEIVVKVGADGTAPDAMRALDLAGRLVAALSPREVFCA